MLGENLTYISLQPLQESALSDLVSQTLRQSRESVALLVSALARHSHGNPFTARTLLLLLKTEDQVRFHYNYFESKLNTFARSNMTGLAIPGRQMPPPLLSFSTLVQRSIPMMWMPSFSCNVFVRYTSEKSAV